MMLFIVKAKVHKSRNWADKGTVEEIMHPVEAKNSIEAGEILKKHYTKVEGDVHQVVTVVKVFETLSR